MSRSATFLQASKTYVRMNDHDIVKQVVDGNENAFRFLVQKHQKLVWHVVWRVVGKPDEIEDICQDVFMKVYKNISRFRNESKLSTWIGSIAWNTCSDYLKKHKRDRLDLSGTIPVKAELAMTDDATWRAVHETDMKAVVRKGIEQLPMSYQTVLTLYHLEEFSYHEIEEITGMPEGTVKSCLNRARKQLREILEHALPGEAGVFHRMES